MFVSEKILRATIYSLLSATQLVVGIKNRLSIDQMSTLLLLIQEERNEKRGRLNLSGRIKRATHVKVHGRLMKLH